MADDESLPWLSRFVPILTPSRFGRLPKKAKNGAQARRLLALAAIYEGGTRTQAACIGSVTLQIVRDWVVKFNAALMGWTRPDGIYAPKWRCRPAT
jgi:hypothetical protein